MKRPGSLEKHWPWKIRRLRLDALKLRVGQALQAGTIACYPLRRYHMEYELSDQKLLKAEKQVKVQHGARGRHIPDGTKRAQRIKARGGRS